MKKILSHHDHLFKKFLGDITIARDFQEIHLPENIRKLCDFSTLAMESGSFIEPDLHSQCSARICSTLCKQQQERGMSTVFLSIRDAQKD